MMSYPQSATPAARRSRLRQYMSARLKTRHELSQAYARSDLKGRKSPARIDRSRPRTQRSQEPKTREISRHVQTQQWGKLIPYVDELIRQIDLGTASMPSMSRLLASVQDPAAAEKSAFMREVVQTIAVLLKDAMASVVQGNTADATSSAKRIGEVLLAAQEISRAASEEGLASIPASQIVQIDVIRGRPIYALK